MIMNEVKTLGSLKINYANEEYAIGVITTKAIKKSKAGKLYETDVRMSIIFSGTEVKDLLDYLYGTTLPSKSNLGNIFDNVVIVGNLDYVKNSQGNYQSCINATDIIVSKYGRKAKIIVFKSRFQSDEKETIDFDLLSNNKNPLDDLPF
jgi:hypothetical protein